jgi:exportin-7
MPSFKKFMEPFDLAMRSINQTLQSQANFANAETHQQIIALYRDLCGVVKSVSKASTESAYECFHDWFAVNGFGLTRLIIEVFYQNQEVMTPVLRFLTEFVFNTQNRIVFPSNSPSGIILFRNMTDILETMSNHHKQLPNTTSDLYRSKLKGILLAIITLDRLFAGEYIYFGAFSIYGDNCTSRAITAVMSMILSVSFEEILAHDKIRRAYYHLIGAVTRYHPLVLAEIPYELVSAILSTLYDGLGSWDVDTSKLAAESLDSLLSYVVGRHLRPFHVPTRSDQVLIEYLRSTEGYMVKVLSRIFRTILFDKGDSSQFLCQLLLTVLLCAQDVFQHFRESLVESQPSEVQSALGGLLDELIRDARSESNPLAVETRNKLQSRLLGMRKDLAPLLIQQ